MIQVRKELCLACGICAQHCSQGAISFPWGQAAIDRGRCNSCRACLEVCPQGAIVEMAPVSTEELGTTLTALKRQTDNLLGRIEVLRG